MNDFYKITIQSRLSELDKIRSFIYDKFSDNEISEKDIFNLALAVDEACTNIIKYAHKDNLSKPINLEFIKSDNEITIKIYDEGKPFDPSIAEIPDLEKHIKSFARGGLGIHIIRSVIDQIKYIPADNYNKKNTLELKKKLLN